MLHRATQATSVLTALLRATAHRLQGPLCVFATVCFLSLVVATEQSLQDAGENRQALKLACLSHTGGCCLLGMLISDPTVYAAGVLVSDSIGGSSCEAI